MKVETYVLKGWEESTAGLLVAENNEWILVKHIPVDFAIDGYRLYKKAFVKKREHGEEELKIERVLRLKGVEDAAPEGFTFSDTIGLIKWIEAKYGIFEFQDDDESELFYAKLKSAENGILMIDVIGSNGEVETDFDYEFEIDKIRVMEFETDYHLSMVLLTNDRSPHLTSPTGEEQ